MKKSILILVAAVIAVVAIAGVYFMGGTEQKNKWIIGAPIYLTGEFSTVGQAQVTMIEYELEKINQVGVAGKTIETIILDTKCDAAEEIKVIKSLVTGSNVDLIHAQLSDAIPPMLPFIEEHNMLITNAGAGTTLLDNQPWYSFRFAPSDSVAGAARGLFIEQNYGNTKIAVLYEEREGPKLDALACRDALVRMGIDIADEISLVPEQASYKETVRRLQNEGIETIAVAFMTSTAIQFFRDCESFDYRPNIVGSNDMCSSEVIDAVGSYMEGAEAAYGGFDTTTTWYKEWEATVPMAEWTTNNIMTPGSWELIYATYNRDAMIGIALGLEYAKTAEPHALADAIRYVCNSPGVEVGTYEEGAELLRDGKDINFQGAAGPIDFNQYNNVLSAGTVQKIVNGAWEQTGIIPADELAEAVGWT